MTKATKTVSKRLFTSESVTEGHPDKMCDMISDSILDALLTLDPKARVACETTASTGCIHIMGEITTDCYVDISKVARQTIKEIGYNRAKYGFDSETCAVITNIDEQSADIAQGVNGSLEDREACRANNGITLFDLEKEREEAGMLDTGAGDQGMMFGFACKETKELMPLPIVMAHALCRKLTEVRKSGLLSYLRPDGKSQVTIEYENDKPVRVDTIVISSQHSPEVTNEKLREEIIVNVIVPVLYDFGFNYDNSIKTYINPTGRFVVGGPQGDTGLTGRKIIVDTYGGAAHHGGGAFSGKDATKVDRSGAYYGRYVAKNLVAAGLCERCEIQVSYAIGVAKPTSIAIDTFGTGLLSNQELVTIVEKVFDFRPKAIIEQLDLQKPVFKQTAAYGHFGRNDLDLTWERTDRVDEICAAVIELEEEKKPGAKTAKATKPATKATKTATKATKPATKATKPATKAKPKTTKPVAKKTTKTTEPQKTTKCK